MPGTTGFSPRPDGDFDLICRLCGIVGRVSRMDEVAQALSRHIAKVHDGYTPTNPA
jgi:hypothetical protein